MGVKTGSFFIGGTSVVDERRDSLDESVARMRRAMDQAWRGGAEPRMRDAWERAWKAPLEGVAGDPRAWKDAWREQKRALRAQRRMRRGGGSRARGFIFLGMAAVLTYLVFDGGPFWMLWVAFGLCFPGVSLLFSGGRQEDVVEGAATPISQPAPDPANLTRVDALCEKLLEEIRKGPAVLREVVRNPEESVRGLRDTIHELAKREAELRLLVTGDDGERLQRERVDVVARRDAATDGLTRERWEGALNALDAQLQHRETLRTQGARLEAERVRLGYTLENLYTQVLAVRSSAGSDTSGAQLKAGVERLGDEISAVADALESMQAVDAGVAGSEKTATPPSRTRA